MTELECGDCTACCEWGDDSAIRPVLTRSETMTLRHTVISGVNRLEMDERGKCVYLIEGGCSIYSHRPEQCRKFDCRDLYNSLKGKTFIEVITIGKEKS